MIPMDRYVTTYDTEDRQIDHLGGITWNEAPRPRRWHRCWAQSRLWTNYLTLTSRCACGAIGRQKPGEFTVWIEKNSRRKGGRS